MEYSPPREAVHKDLWELVQQQNAASARRAMGLEDRNSDISIPTDKNNVGNENNERTEMEEENV